MFLSRSVRAFEHGMIPGAVGDRISIKRTEQWLIGLLIVHCMEAGRTSRWVTAKSVDYYFIYCSLVQQRNVADCPCWTWSGLRVQAQVRQDDIGSVSGTSE